jgi:SAM-dependent methyltransferase
VHVHEVVNTEQLAAWDGDEGEHWSTYEEHYDASVRVYSQVLADVAAIGPGERVLDLGCGCGSTTRAAARAAPAGAAVGIDLSSQMLERARRHSVEEELDNVTFVHGDAQVHDFGAASFDVVISRFGAMFFADPIAAFTNVGGAMGPDGRMVLIAWQALERNEWLTAIRGALAQGRQLPTPPAGAPGPLAFADPEHVRTMLAAAGFRDVEIDAVEADFRLGADVDDALEFIGGVGVVRGLLQDLDPEQQQAARGDLRAVIESHARSDGVCFGSSTWTIRAIR